MRWVLSLVLLGAAVFLAVGKPISHTKQPSTATGPKQISHTAKTASGTAKANPRAAKAMKGTERAATSKPAAGGSSRFSKGGKGRGRNSAVLARAQRVPPPPSYQLHPDPERYQQIQQALADRGYFKGEVNGVWSDDSTDALRKFQADQKLPDDGKITALSLTGLGLGPRHDGSTASAVPIQPAPDPVGETPASIPPP
jgi:hypothetical protein